MDRRFYLLSLGMGALLLATSQVFAQPNPRNCGPRDAIITRLSEDYGESRRSIGLGANNQVMEVFASLETGSWTITVTLPNGMMCLVASGQAYEALADALPPGGNDV